MQCHTVKDSDNGNDYYHYADAERYDYPSIGQIVDVINKNEILVIFAVTADQVDTYSELQKLLPHATVGELDDKSTEVISIVEQKYRLLSQKVSLKYSELPEGVTARVFAKCNNDDDQPDAEKGICNGVKAKGEVEFEVELIWDENPEGQCPSKSQNIEFAIYGMDAKTEVNLNFICDCQCQVQPIPRISWILSTYNQHH